MGAILRYGKVLGIAAFCCATAFGQQIPLAPQPALSRTPVFATQPTLLASNSAPLETATFVSTPTAQRAEQHKFWDTENSVLFVAVGAFAAADFAVTRSNLQNGGRELNPLVRPFAGSTAGLAANFAGETAGVIGLSYFFHKTGHHKLERLTSMVDVSMSGFAVGYGFAHR